MAMGSSSGDGNQPLSEINVTPLVDVMLVLLVIFMIASGLESAAVEQELEQLRSESFAEEPAPPPDVHPSQKVEVDLPQVNAKQVNLTEEQKLVLSIDGQYDFYLGDTMFLRCQGAQGPSTDKTDAAFDACLLELEEKLVANQKLQTDQELYLRGDRHIPYGRVLAAMARIRQAGVTKFGLIADLPAEPK